MSDTISDFEEGTTIFWVGDDIKDNENNIEKLKYYLGKNITIEKCKTEKELFEKGNKFELIYVVINGNLIENFFKLYSQKKTN